MNYMQTNNVTKHPLLWRGLGRLDILGRLLLLLLLPLNLWAADGEFDTPSQAISWYSKGPGCMHVKILALEQSANRTLDYSTFYVTDSEGNRTDFLYFHESNSYDKDRSYVQVIMRNLISDESLVYLTNDYDVKPLYYIGDANQARNVTRSSKDVNGYAEFDWYYPVRFAGKKMTLCVDGQILNRDRDIRTQYQKVIGAIEFDDIMLESYDPIPGTEAADVGTISLPVVSDHAINWVEAKYQDVDGQWKNMPRQTMDQNAYSAFLRLPAYEAIDTLIVTANVTSATISKSDVPSGKNWPTELKGNMTLKVANVPMMHGPRFLTAEVDSAGAVQLEWKIADTGHGDLFEGDVFDVQRSLTGKLEDFESLGQESFDLKTTSYQFSDETLIPSLTKELVDAKTGTPLVRYRVVRATVQELWGTSKNPCLAYVQPQMATLSLLQPDNATAKWTDTLEYKIEVKWEYKPSAKDVHYVWDKRAEMSVKAMQYNREGKLVDSLVHVLSMDEIEQKKASLALTRSCVSYELFVEVDGRESPIGQGEGHIFELIGSREEFEMYASDLYYGKSRIAPNAILTSNITLNTETAQKWLGWYDNHPYTGNLNGNGHTLTMNYPNYNVDDYISPIRFAGSGAVICYLTTAGTNEAKKQFASGLVGMVSTGELFIENCISSMNFKPRNYGDASLGGFLGIVDLNSGTDDSKCVRISNCLYNGNFLMNWAYNVGGFVGWRRSATFGMISNSFWQPTGSYDPPSQAGGSATFMRHDGSNPCWNVIQDCRYSKKMGTLLQGALSETAPENDCWKDGMPVIKQVGFSTPTGSNRCRVSIPADRFYYQSTGKVDTTSLETVTLQSSVLLKWKKTEGAVDYFEVKRRNVTTNEPWKVIATQITDMEYEDKTVSPVFDYLYKVSSNNDCEGLETTETDSVPGHCIQHGKVEGYVRFADGTGIPGIYVTASQYGEGANPAYRRSTMTDESGFYRIDSLAYWGYQQGEYLLTIAVDGSPAEILSEECKDGLSVTFDYKSNYMKNRTFTVVKGVRFSGLVMYSGTSIPVHGARFLIDGREARTSGGPVETDFEGKFSFRMLGGLHNIQCVMDGHDFWQNGYYKNTSDKVNFDVDVANVYFYDETRVKLIGRVAGGQKQGQLPLGNSLSTNNLGNNLKMVLTLEGDNASWLVFDNLHRSITERDTVYIHKKYGKTDTNEYKTRVHTTRHRMEVWPDSLTGEYEVLLPPVKWKIQQISAEGYATLFQEGKTSDVIDLTDSLTLHNDILKGEWKSRGGDSFNQLTVSYNAQYSRIYRSPVLLERKQVGYDKFDYFGEKSYTMRTLTGESIPVPIAYAVTTKDEKTKKDVTTTHYTFDYPVFSTDRGYNLQLSAVERYYYNNNMQSDTVDVVRLDGGFVTVRNGFMSGTQRDTLSLDSLGEGIYTLRAAQRPYLLTGKDALCTATFTMLRDGVTCEAEPLKGYVFSQYAKQGAKDIMSIDRPVLVDILRDPPGAGSSAKLSKGSTLKLAYQMDMAWKGGLSLGISAGGGLNMYTGTVMLAAEFGLINSTKAKFNTSFDLVFSGSGQRAFSYTMTVAEDISTDAGSTMVGADADVYMGMETNVFVRPTVAIQAINDSVFKTMGGALAAGRMVEIASGRDQNDSIYHLVRSEVLGYGQKVNSTFAHSQQYIVKQLMPALANEIESLMFTGTEAEAKTLANATGKPVYLSLIKDAKSKRFAVVNTDSVNNYAYVYNTDRNKFEDQSKMNYLIVLPNGYDDTAKEDRVHDLSNTLYTWGSIIARNEKEKLEASSKMKNFDVDGGSSITYSEDFATEYSNTSSYNWIFSDYTHNYFANPDPDDPDAYGDKERTAAAFSSMAGILGPTVAKLLFSLLSNSPGMKTGSVDVGKPTTNLSPLAEKDFEITGTVWKFSLTPVVAFGVTPKNSETTKYNRKESFTIKMDKKSHLDFDVYYSKLIDSRDSTTVDSRTDVFVEENFLNNVDYMEYFLDRDVGTRDIVHDMVKPRGFIYRTRGGATVRTWEPERKTMFYRAGTVLDERTKKIENPVIKMDKQSISGVPLSEPARFKLYMTNESEAPEAIGGSLQFFTLYLDETTNPAGARLLVDGLPLSRAGITVKAVPGETTEKTLEVWAGEDYDYENLKIGLISPGDVQCVQEVAFSAHFLRSAGNVEIATPGDKWIMNTDAPYDQKRGWYMPVIISGFNKNQKNFDHIEFQYKESTRGDDYWTNLCAFYADSVLYRQATGTHEMIPENGNIVTKFYGEGTVMEKAYDLRARLYCRNGNSFITSDSKVLSGIKDTRRPQLFGSPEPKDGIVGAGDNIVFHFSEAIEHNYLQQATNFEVVGETNETALSEEPSLLFDGLGYAETDARRNFANKNMTIDLMIYPDTTNRDMPLFSHGIDGRRLQLWITKDWRLRAVVDSTTFESKTVMAKGRLQQVALILDNDHQQALLFNDSIVATKDSVTYNGYGKLVFGATNEVDTGDRKHYNGRMLEARLWNRAMTEALLRSYGKRQLTGFEMGLADYYPMNDGEGQYAVDKAQGANAELHGTSWALPRGMSLFLDWGEQKPVKGLQLDYTKMVRSAEQDYTLMFWFKTNNWGQGALVSNGSGRRTDADAPNKFFIGFEAGQLKYRTNGYEVLLGKQYADDDWHHFAITVDRAHQVANIYVDRTLSASFSTDTLGGMTGSDFYVGNMVWHEAGADVQTLHSQNALTGHVDELCLFAQALPYSLLKRFTSKSPTGREKGLLVYMGFNRQQRQKDNELELMPFALNQVMERNAEGNYVEKGDSIFLEPVSLVMQHIDKADGAPVLANQELRNLNFSFVGRDNQLLVNIDELDSRINKRNIFVTVTDVPDLNGNYMASPVTHSFFIDRNPLRWERKSWEEVIYSLRDDDDFDFAMKVMNNSGAPHTYTIENLPRWLSVNKQVDIIDPKGEHTLYFSVSKDLNVGTYDEIIYLTDEDGLAEPLALTIRKEGSIPDWNVTYDMKHFSMNIIGQVKIGDAIVTDAEDLVGAFDSMGRCMGVAHINFNPATSQSQLFLTVFDTTSVERPLVFKLWHHQTGQTMMLQTSPEVKFRHGQVVGSVDNPVIMKAGSLFYQQLNIMPGWNWISFNVSSNAYRDPVTMMNQYHWENGDIVTDDTEDFTLVYNTELGTWLANKSVDINNIRIYTERSYRLFVQHYHSVEIPGYLLKAESERTVHLKHGWNNIGYTPMVNLPVSTALADYTGIAENRDVVKSREEFAVFTETKKGSGYWSGSLQYMKPGEGYMLYRNGQDEASFYYPFYEPGNSFFERTVAQTIGIKPQSYPHTMSLAAIPTGVELQEADRLLAFSEGELRGAARAIDSVFYVSISGDKKAPLSFAIERDGELIATTAEVMVFESNAVSGSPAAPTAISFTPGDAGPARGWYTVEGYKLPDRPQRKGVYIYNGKKQVIK